MKLGEFLAGYGGGESIGFELIGFGEGLVDELQDVRAVAFPLELAAGDFRFDESGDAFLEVGNGVGFGKEFFGDRDAGHGWNFSMVF